MVKVTKKPAKTINLRLYSDAKGKYIKVGNKKYYFTGKVTIRKIVEFVKKLIRKGKKKTVKYVSKKKKVSFSEKEPVAKAKKEKKKVQEYVYEPGEYKTPLVQNIPKKGDEGAPKKLNPQKQKEKDKKEQDVIAADFEEKKITRKNTNKRTRIIRELLQSGYEEDQIYGKTTQKLEAELKKRLSDSKERVKQYKRTPARVEVENALKGYGYDDVDFLGITLKELRATLASEKKHSRVIAVSKNTGFLPKGSLEEKKYSTKFPDDTPSSRPSDPKDFNANYKQPENPSQDSSERSSFSNARSSLVLRDIRQELLEELRKMEEDGDISTPILSMLMDYFDRYVTSNNISEINDVLLDYAKNEATMPKSELITKLRGLGKKKVGKDGISNVDIDSIMKSFGKEFLGVIACDELDKILPKIKPQSRGGFIVNTDKSSGPGEHWQAIYFDARPEGENTINFYDSYADPASEDVEDIISKLSKKLKSKYLLKYKFNTVKQQRDNSSNCGFFACKFLKDRFNGVPWIEASGYNKASKVLKGEKDIEKFKKQVGYGAPPAYGYIKGSGVLTPLEGLQRNRYPPAVRNFLDANGSKIVVQVDVGRDPVFSILEKALNVISRGQYEQNKRALNYDKMFHLYTVITLNDGRKYKLQKNEVIDISNFTGFGKGSQHFMAGRPMIPLSQFLENGRAYHERSGRNFYYYDPFSNNCQDFVTSLINGNNLGTSTSNEFIKQDAAAVVKNAPWTRIIARNITNLGSVLNVLRFGRGNKNDF